MFGQTLLILLLIMCVFWGVRSHWIGQQLPQRIESVTVKHVYVIFRQMTDRQKGLLERTYNF